VKRLVTSVKPSCHQNNSYSPTEPPRHLFEAPLSMLPTHEHIVRGAARSPPTKPQATCDREFPLTTSGWVSAIRRAGTGRRRHRAKKSTPFFLRGCPEERGGTTTRSLCLAVC